MSALDKILLIALVLFVYGLLCWICLRRSDRHDVLVSENIPEGDSNLLVTYASQSGTALSYARQLIETLNTPARLLSLDRVDDDVLASTTHALFVVSTYGEGEPPDNGARFARNYLTASAKDLSHLKYAVLALGDRSYQYFCGFGHSVFQGLRHHGAAPLFPAVELDSQHEYGATRLSHWYGQLRESGISTSPFHGGEQISHQHVAAFSPWIVTARHKVNPGSPGEPLFHLCLTPSPSAPDQNQHWLAGDIAEVKPRNRPELCLAFAEYLQLPPDQLVTVEGRKTTVFEALSSRQLPSDFESWPDTIDEPVGDFFTSLPRLTHREYSIASVVEDSTLNLLVRQQKNNDGSLGLSSGWLTAYTEIGCTIELRIRSNPLFRAPEDDVPLILIGNGSGYAGLHAILRARELAGLHKNWLLFGERCPQSDRIFSNEITAWQQAGHLQRVDLTFSRCPSNPAYVQDALLASEDLSTWVDQGAVIMVCGSREGMAEGVDAALRKVLGGERLEQMQMLERYRRDVY